MPAEIAADPVAAAAWQLFTTNSAPGHLAPVDAPLLRQLCAAISKRDAAERAMGADMVIKAPNTGLPIQSPYLAIINRQSVLVERFLSALCLTPAERNRLGVHDWDQVADQADKYFTN